MKCPYCAEEIQSDAKKCKHCGEWLDTTIKTEQPPTADSVARGIRDYKAKSNAVGCLGILFLIIAVIVGVKVNAILGFIIFFVGVGWSYNKVWGDKKKQKQKKSV